MDKLLSARPQPRKGVHAPLIRYIDVHTLVIHVLRALLVQLGRKVNGLLLQSNVA
jgi:hypothetical protein